MPLRRRAPKVHPHEVLGFGIDGPVKTGLTPSAA
jgi:hypothetical protein